MSHRQTRELLGEAVATTVRQRPEGPAKIAEGVSLQGRSFRSEARKRRKTKGAKHPREGRSPVIKKESGEATRRRHSFA